jgi:2-oxoglutarate ferredoxin oxidoreductase subunit alpha
MILTDLDLGMNTHMVKTFKYPNKPMDRGKVLWEEDIQKLVDEGKIWGRYADVDGDGIPYRTLPGNRNTRAAYFARGTGHDEMTRYSEDPTVWEHGMDRLKKKINSHKELYPRPEVQKMDGAKFGIIAYGSTGTAIDEARDLLAPRHSNGLSGCVLPFNDEVWISCTYERTYVVEMNRRSDAAVLAMIILIAAHIGFSGTH